jgi:hypothetical protein
MLSRIAALFAATAGCAASGYDVAPRDVPALVSEYQTKRQVTGIADGETLKVTESHSPRLAFDARRCFEPSGGKCLEREFQLGQLAVSDDEIVATSGERYRPRDIRSATLTLKNDPRTHTLQHRLGAQLGSTGFLQAFYRFRAVGPLFLEVGFLGLPLTPPAANGSAGLVIDVPVAALWSVYGGAGGGFAFGSGESEEGLGVAGVAFGYGRLGFSFLFDTKQKTFLAFDGGIWRGELMEDDAGDTSSRPFLWPMAGFAIIKAL